MAVTRPHPKEPTVLFHMNSWMLGERVLRDCVVAEALSPQETLFCPHPTPGLQMPLVLPLSSASHPPLILPQSFTLSLSHPDLSSQALLLFPHNRLLFPEDLSVVLSASGLGLRTQ